MPAGVNSRAAKKPLGRILVVRHAQTQANIDEVYLGQRDIELSPLGIEQSRAAIEGIAAWQPDRIFTSPLARCAVAIADPAAAACGLRAQRDDRITEMDFGPLEGLGYRTVEELGMPLPWGPTSSAWPAGSGEPVEDFKERIGAAFADYAQLEGKTCVVAHGGVIRGMLAACIGFNFNRFWDLVVGNVSGYLLDSYGDHLELVRYGLEPDQFARYR